MVIKDFLKISNCAYCTREFLFEDLNSCFFKIKSSSPLKVKKAARKIIQEINKQFFCEDCFNSASLSKIKNIKILKVKIFKAVTIVKIASIFYQLGICNFTNIACMEEIFFFINNKKVNIALFIIDSKSFDDEDLSLIINHLIDYGYIVEAMGCILRLDSEELQLEFYAEIINNSSQLFPPENIKMLKIFSVVLPLMNRSLIVVLKNMRESLILHNPDTKHIWMKYKILLQIGLIYSEYRCFDDIEEIILILLQDKITSLDTKIIVVSLIAILTNKISRINESEGYFEKALKLSENIDLSDEQNMSWFFLLETCNHLQKNKEKEEILSEIKKNKIELTELF